MGFSRKRKITHIFKIMNGIDLVDSQDILQMNAFVTHDPTVPFCENRLIVQNIYPI